MSAAVLLRRAASRHFRCNGKIMPEWKRASGRASHVTSDAARQARSQSTARCPSGEMKSPRKQPSSATQCLIGDDRHFISSSSGGLKWRGRYSASWLKHSRPQSTSKRHAMSQATRLTISARIGGIPDEARNNLSLVSSPSPHQLIIPGGIKRLR